MNLSPSSLQWKASPSPDYPKERSGHTYEVKLDGYRAQVIQTERLRLLSRRGTDLSRQFSETCNALRSAFPANTIVDGELVALDSQGHPNFQLLQNRGTSGAPAVFFAFDILVLGGRDVRSLPLSQRRKLLTAFRDRQGTSRIARVRQ